MVAQKKAILTIQPLSRHKTMCFSNEELLKILANPTRRAILQWLKQPEVSFESYTQLYNFDQYGVCASLIQHKAGLSQPATSLSLKILLDAQLVKATRVGKWTYFKRNETTIQNNIKLLLEDLKNI